MRTWLGLLGLSLGFLSLCGCELFDGGDPDGDGRGDLGETCSGNDDCRLPLVCGTDGMCEGAADVQEGDACQLTGECEDGLYCSHNRVCEPAGTGVVDDPCETSADCEPGFICTLNGFFAACSESGSGGIGTECSGDADCAAGLNCLAPTARSQCLSAPAGSPPVASIPFWDGVQCEEATGGPRAYFEVPHFDGNDKDFYRLPFPNDIRRTADGLDLRNHPTPETAVDGEIISDYLRAIEEDVDGFSMNPVGYFRFSEPYSWDTVNETSVKLIDIEEGSETYGVELSRAWQTTAGPISKYICNDWLAVRTPSGGPLRPDHTYAFVIHNSIRPDAGGTFARDDDFEAMLAGTRPSDATLGTAWDKYQPLRDYLETDGAIAAGEVLNAAVFTTQNELDMAPFREAIRADAAPATSDLTECGDGVTSPCDDGTPQRKLRRRQRRRIHRNPWPHRTAYLSAGHRTLHAARGRRPRAVRRRRQTHGGSN